MQGWSAQVGAARDSGRAEEPAHPAAHCVFGQTPRALRLRQLAPLSFHSPSLCVCVRVWRHPVALLFAPHLICIFVRAGRPRRAERRSCLTQVGTLNDGSWNWTERASVTDCAAARAWRGSASGGPLPFVLRLPRTAWITTPSHLESVCVCRVCVARRPEPMCSFGGPRCSAVPTRKVRCNVFSGCICIRFGQKKVNSVFKSFSHNKDLTVCRIISEGI